MMNMSDIWPSDDLEDEDEYIGLDAFDDDDEDDDDFPFGFWDDDDEDDLDELDDLDTVVIFAIMEEI